MTETTVEGAHADSRRSRRPLAPALVALCLAGIVGFALWSWITHPLWSQEEVPPGQRVAMANGLSLTAPSAPGAETRRDAVRWRAGWLYRGSGDYDEQVTVTQARGSEQPIVALASFRGDPRSSISVEAATAGQGLPPLVYTSPDGRAKVYWREGDLVLLVVTAIPGKQAGLIELIGLQGVVSSDGATVSRATAKDASRVLATVWRDLNITGLSAPKVP